MTTKQTVVATAYFPNVYGRLRDVTAGPGNTVWMLTNNTDGRGAPAQGDDKLLQVKMTSVGGK